MGFCFLGLFFILTLVFSTFASQQPNTDGYFVSDFLQKMGVEDSPELYNFSSPFCLWRGVFCDGNGENVVKLVFSGMGLSGVIPDTTIGKLRNLQYLDLSNNKMTAFPSDLWSLGSIKYLNLSLNRIYGSLPSNIGNFGLLESLDLSSNSFSGSIPEAMSSLASLQMLKLNKNGFESNFPLGLLQCHSLNTLDFSENKLNGEIPNGFASAFPKLTFLSLAGNDIIGSDEDFTGMVSLIHLNLSRNLFKGSVVNIFLEELEVLDLSRNRFDGEISQVNFGSRLVYLDLSENELSGESFSVLKVAQNLTHLNLAHNRFSTQEFPQIDMINTLEYLNLSGDNLIGEIPSEIARLSSLKTLDLSENHLTSHIPLLSVKSLQILDVSYNNLSGEIPLSILGKLPWMERYNFSFNNLTFCGSEISTQTLQSAFIGSLNSCPIAANPDLFKKKTHKHTGLELALALTMSMVFLLVGLIFLAFGCRRNTKMSANKEERNISGPFSFQTDSTTWTADVKEATSVSVVIFEKPLLNFTFADLLSATSQFDRSTLLAEGRFGPVYRGVLSGGIHVAVKVLVHGSTMTDQEAAKELGYLGRIKHPNLVPLTGYCLAGDQRLALYGYMENGNLQNLLHENVGFEGLLMTWRFRHKIALGTARALAFLHHGCSPPIIHRDVKASSVYLDMNYESRLSDFGLAKLFGNTLEDEITRGSPGYVPPELLQAETASLKEATPKSDVYGFGVILFELITGKKPVEDEYSEKEGDLVSWVRGLVKKNEGSIAIDPKIRGTGAVTQIVEALKIGYLCTADVPLKRPSMQQVVGLLKDIEPVLQQ